MFRIVLIAAICLAALPHALAQGVTLDDVLNAFAANMEKQRSFITTFEQHDDQPSRIPGEPAVIIDVTGEIIFDGVGLCRYRSYSWGNVHSFGMTNYPRETPLYGSRLWDGTGAYEVRQRMLSPDYRGMLTVYPEETDRIRHDMYKKLPGGWSLGYFNTRRRIDEVIRLAPPNNVSMRTESYDGVWCHVVKFNDHWGTGTVWFDLARGASVVRYIENSDYIRVFGGSAHHGQIRIENVELALIGGAWVGMGCTIRRDIKLHGPLDAHYFTTYRRLRIALNPDCDAGHYFEVTDVRDGWPVQRMVWTSRGYQPTDEQMVWRSNQAMEPAPKTGSR